MFLQVAGSDIIVVSYFLVAEVSPCRESTGGSAQSISYCLLCKAEHILPSRLSLPALHHIPLHGQLCA